MKAPEAVFISSVILVVLLSFFLLNIFSQQNSKFTKQLATSTKLAQEGVITMMGMKNADSFNQSACTDLKDPTINCGDFILSTCDNSPCIEKNTDTYTSPSWKVSEEESFYSRKVRITEENDKKEITVLVWWTDDEGLHKTVLTRQL